MTEVAAQDRLEQYERIVATIPEVERKGKTVPYTSVHGNMFSYLAKSGRMALRLPEPARSEFLERYQTTLCQEYGVVQPEYVVVPDALLENTVELESYFAASYSYTCALKSKATTRKTKV
jgi:hypothetical protein